jgi:hypothetical protein
MCNPFNMYPGMMAGMPYGGQHFPQNRMMNMRTVCRVEFPLLQLAARSARATSRVPLSKCTLQDALLCNFLYRIALLL